jgi:hypothetical protein
MILRLEIYPLLGFFLIWFIKHAPLSTELLHAISTLFTYIIIFLTVFLAIITIYCLLCTLEDVKVYSFNKCAKLLMQKVVVHSYRRFGTTYRFHLEG